ncbi:MAG: chemotaxis protein CheW [Proteobacteria bacterium]|nr:chemotaxis protein CheW [Pseudomonadota bacterium]HQR03826.1 chemotaxis protein CheW [Rhodocyclaceae bacterium]
MTATETTTLRDFQEGLAQRLTRAGQGATTDALLAVEAGNQGWLLTLGEAGEVLPPPPITPVPLTRPWYAGLVNVRGMLYSVVDLAAFSEEGAVTLPEADSRLLLVGVAHGINSALLVTRVGGLRPAAGFVAREEAPDPGQPWVGAVWRDVDGRAWRRLDVPRLLAAPRFLDIAR